MYEPQPTTRTKAESVAATTGNIAGTVFVLARHSTQHLSTATIADLTLLTLWRWKVPEPIIVAGSGIAGLPQSSLIGGI